MAFACYVRCPAGVVFVMIDRHGLELADRGGFEASWQATPTGEEALALEDFRARVKDELKRAHKAAHGRSPANIPLNLASHQLVDDLLGWTKLNYPR